MSGGGAIDLRIPIGWLFVALGVIVAGYGAATNGNAEMYQRSENLNINLIWGVVMLAFGLLFLLLASRAARRGAHRPLAETRAGDATEAREKARGLER